MSSAALAGETAKIERSAAKHDQTNSLHTMAGEREEDEAKDAYCISTSQFGGHQWLAKDPASWRRPPTTMEFALSSSGNNNWKARSQKATDDFGRPDQTAHFRPPATANASRVLVKCERNLWAPSIRRVGGWSVVGVRRGKTLFASVATVQTPTRLGACERR